MTQSAVNQAIAIQANVQASIAAQQAHEARVTACRALMPQYTDEAATTEARRAYAECVNVVYPKQMERTDVLWVKALIVVTLVCMVLGMVRATVSRTDAYERQYHKAGKWRFDGGEAVFGAIGGCMLGQTLTGVAWCLWFVVRG